MPVVELRAGMKINIPDQHEIGQVVKGTWEAHEREAARTVKWIDQVGTGFDPIAGTAQNNYLIPGPDSGWAWSVKVIGVSIAAAGTVVVYKTSSAKLRTRPIGVAASVAGPSSVNLAVFTFSSNAGFLQHDQQIWIESTQNITTWYMGVEEAMSEAAWRIFD